MIFKHRHREVPGLNTTSTADISFMLLIFFLVTTSMDTDKGLNRQLPAESKNKNIETSMVDKQTTMMLKLTANNQILMNEKPVDVVHLRQYAVNFIEKHGAKHLISLESDREADYNTYFKMQNALVSAYHEVRNHVSARLYHKMYDQLNQEQKNTINNKIPNRIAESYANASVDTVATKGGNL